MHARARAVGRVWCVRCSQRLTISAGNPTTSLSHVSWCLHPTADRWPLRAAATSPQPRALRSDHAERPQRRARMEPARLAARNRLSDDKRVC